MDIKAGDEVRVFDQNGRQMGQPAGGWVGRVAKTGRTLAYVTYPGAWPPEGEKFSMSDGYRPNDGYRHRYILTMDEVARRERRASAMAAINAAHVEITLSHRAAFSVERLEELAAVVKTWPQD
jgi:hypothetical protein